MMTDYAASRSESLEVNVSKKEQSVRRDTIFQTNVTFVYSDPNHFPFFWLLFYLSPHTV